MENYQKILQKKEKVIIDEEEFKQNHREFYLSIGDEVNKDNGVFSYENNDLKLEIVTEKFYLGDIEDKNRRISLSGILNPPEDYLLIKNYILKNKESELNISNELKDLIVVINKNSRGSLPVGQFFKHFNLIRLNSEISTPEGILTFFHEIGHLKDIDLDNTDKLLQDLRMESVLSPDDKVINDQISAIEIKEERTAWAYAINKLKPYIKGLGVSDDSINDFVHKFLLGSYCKDINDSHA